MIKICNRCDVEKLFSQFSKHPRGKNGLHPTCNSCRNKQARTYYKNNKEHIKKLPSRLNRDWHESDIKRKFGITKLQYDKLLEKQKGVCAVCKSKPLKKRLAVDHCHKTNLVRGLLCSDCNMGIGLFKDNPETLKTAIIYLVG